MTPEEIADMLDKMCPGDCAECEEAGRDCVMEDRG